MIKLAPQRRIKREGRQTSEHTDSEYEEKTLCRMMEDYRNCPKEWRDTFLAGLSQRQFERFKEAGLVKAPA